MQACAVSLKMIFRNLLRKRICLHFATILIIFLLIYLTRRLLDLMSEGDYNRHAYSGLPRYSVNWMVLNGNNFLAEYCEGFPFWTILVVDPKVNISARHHNCISFPATWLNAEDSLEISLPLVQHAYLFAITHGARYIYAPNTSEDEFKKTLREGDMLVRLSLTTSSTLTIPDDRDSFDFTNYYGCSDKSKDCLRKYSLCSSKQPAVIALSHVENKIWKENFECNSRMPPIALKPNQFVFFNANYSVIGYSSFWALPILYNNTYTSPDINIKRSCLIHWLLWQSGDFIKYFWDGVHFVPSDRPKEKPCVSTLEGLHKCGLEAEHFHDCILSTIQKVLSNDEFKDVHKWLHALKMSGYKFEMKNLNLENCSEVVINTAEYCCIKEPSFHRQYLTVANSKPIQANYKKTCKKSFESESAINFNEPWFQKPNILLLIVFNKAHYNVIPHLEMLYRPFFPLIMYCGPEGTNPKESPYLSNHNSSFITFDIQASDQVPGALNYQCILKVFQMNFKVDGYLNIADDLLLLNHAISDLDTNMAWFIPKEEIRIGDLKTLKECRLGLCDFFNRWEWWTDYRNVSLALLDEVDSLSRSSIRFRMFKRAIENATGSKGRLLGGYSDVFYLPRRLSVEFIELAELFLKHKVFLEIAIPSIIRSFSLYDHVYPLRGLQVWDKKTRDIPWVRFKKSELFGKFYFHPTKWSSVGRENIDNILDAKTIKNAIGDESDPLTNRVKVNRDKDGWEMSYNVNNSLEMTNLLCNSVLPYMFDSLGRLPR